MAEDEEMTEFDQELDAIIREHDSLTASVISQKMYITDQKQLLDRLQRIGNVYRPRIFNREFTEDDLQQWNDQLVEIKKYIAIAS
ncbi:unnamed protein product, partial [Didymodactylos carnosus]